MDALLESARYPLVKNAAVTVVVLLLLLITRKIVLRAIFSDTTPPDVRRRIEVNSRNGVFVAALLVGFFIWAEEIRTLAISAFAVAAAIVLATKELIMCVSGSLLRSGASAFEVGDRIEVGAHRGDVIDVSLLTTRLVEIGPGQATHQHTGRTISLPNSLFLTQPVINETYTDEYVLHVFTVPIAATDPWEDAERALLEASRACCAAYLDDARLHFDQMVGRHALEPVQVEPRVSIRKAEPGRIDLIVRIPTPARQKGRIEQKIVRQFLRETAVVPEEKPDQEGGDPAP